MRLIVEQAGALQLRDVVTPVNFKSPEGELFSICMKDSGFEFEYQGSRYFAKDGVLKPLAKKNEIRRSYVEANPMLM